jgi:hypothetical protein
MPLASRPTLADLGPSWQRSLDARNRSPLTLQAYYECFDRDLADQVSPQQQALFNSGTAVGELARERFGPGLLIEERYFEHPAAVSHTEEAMKDPSITTLFEAAFSFEEINIRADILTKNDDGTFDLMEVKSSTSFKPEHLPDIAIQQHVLEGLGYPTQARLLFGDGIPCLFV